MTDKQVYTVYSEAARYNDPDEYVSDWATSSLFLPQDDPEAEISPELVAQLRTLWHIANDPFKALLDRMGINQTECSIRFCVPLRTVQGWAGETRQTPPYLRLMMAEATGVVDLRRESRKR